MNKLERILTIGAKNSVLAKLRSWGVPPANVAVLVVLILAPVVIRDQYILRLMVVSLLFGAQTIVFDFTTGFINIVNFGFAAFVGLGGYTSALLVTGLGLSPWLGMLGGVVTAGVLGFLTGVLTLRLRGIYAAVMTWFLGLALMALTAVEVDLTRGHWGLNVPLLASAGSKPTYYYVLLAMMVVIYFVLRVVIHSNIGLAFRAIGQDIEAAQSSGVNPTKYRVLNFTLACAFAGLIGGFYAHFVGVLTPDVMSTDKTVEVLALSYIGGRGTLWGGVLASFIFIPLFEYLKSLMELRLIIYGLLLIAVMLALPDGLVGLLRRTVALIRKTRQERKASQ